jgi:hypothetical protein
VEGRDGQTKLRAAAQKGKSGPTSTYRYVTGGTKPTIRAEFPMRRPMYKMYQSDNNRRSQGAASTGTSTGPVPYSTVSLKQIILLASYLLLLLLLRLWYSTIELAPSSQCTLNKSLFRTFVPFGNSRKFNLFHLPQTSLSAVTEVENPTCLMRSNSSC